MFVSMAVMLLAASQASAVFSAVRGNVESNPREFQNKLETAGASLPMGRKLMTAKTWSLADLKIDEVDDCDLSTEGVLYDNCLDTSHGVEKPFPCASGLVCTKFSEWWAQCHSEDAIINHEPESIIKCTGGVAAKAENDESEIKKAKDGESDGVKEVGTDDGKGDGVSEVAGVVNTDAGTTNVGGDSNGSGDNTDGGNTDDSNTDGSNTDGGNTDGSNTTGAGDAGDDGAAAPAPAPEAAAPAPVQTTTDGDETDGGDAEAPAPEPAASGPAGAAVGDGLELPALKSGGDPASCPSEGKWSLSEWGLDEVVGKNFMFFEAQKSGHLSNNRIAWRGDSYMQDEHNGRMLNYGWFDAGDHLKLVFPMAWTIATMAWSVLDSHSLLGSQNFDGNNNKKWALDSLEYGLEFLLDCSYDNGEFVAQVGNTEVDHSYVFRAELDNVTPRKDGSGDKKGMFYTLLPEAPGADLLFNAAAAYAAGAMALQAAGGSNALADRATNKAKELFTMAGNAPGIYSQSIPEAAKTYNSDNWEQYGFFAAAWLLRLTGEANYEQMAEQYMEQANAKQEHADYSWASVYFGATAVMWQHKLDKGEDGATYEAKLAYFADMQVNAKGNLFHTPKGLVYVNQWGPLRHAVGDAGILGLYARGLKGGTSSTGIQADAILAFAESQITYALGASGHSWIVGFGCNPPVNPHHRDSALTMEESGDWDIFTNRPQNANSLVGAMVGGPDENDQGNDDRTDYRLNEVALDYNAAFFFGVMEVAMNFK